VPFSSIAQIDYTRVMTALYEASEDQSISDPVQFSISIAAPIVQAEPGVNKELMVLATGAGSLILSHVNDAGFWLVKEYFQLSLPDTFRTAMETLLSVLGLIFVLLLGLVV
jgi:H+/gluconate symporter-like permease